MALLVAVVDTSADEITPHLAHLSVILYRGTVIWLQSQINTLSHTQIQIHLHAHIPYTHTHTPYTNTHTHTHTHTARTQTCTGACMWIGQAWAWAACHSDLWPVSLSGLGVVCLCVRWHFLLCIYVYRGWWWVFDIMNKDEIPPWLLFFV